MRKISVVAGCIALLALASAGAAAPGYTFSRPHTAFDEFRHDQRLCERKTYAAHVRYMSPVNMVERRGPHGRPSGELKFVRCMIDKGYRLGGNGFSTGPLWALQPSLRNM